MHSLDAWTTGVVEVVPGVPPATISAHLGQPRPDLIRWCVDCDGHRRSSFAIGNQPGAGVRPGDFLIGCAPAHEPRAHPASVDDCCRGCHGCDPAYQLHTPSVRGSQAAPQGTNVTTRPTKFPPWPRRSFADFQPRMHRSTRHTSARPPVQPTETVVIIGRRISHDTLPDPQHWPHHREVVESTRQTPQSEPGHTPLPGTYDTHMVFGVVASRSIRCSALLRLAWLWV
jgi:hypothetical protein